MKTVMGEPGKAMMGTAVGQRPGPRHARPPSRRWPARCSKASTCRARKRRAGADHRGQGQPQAVREPQAGDEHDPRLRRRRCARDLRHGLRREPGRRAARDGGRHRPVAPGPAPHGAADAGAAHRHRQRAAQRAPTTCRSLDPAGAADAAPAATTTAA